MTIPHHEHTWGPTERVDQTFEGKSQWHWCRCLQCGAPGFKITKPDGATVSQVTRCWQECDTIICIPSRLHNQDLIGTIVDDDVEIDLPCSYDKTRK